GWIGVKQLDVGTQQVGGQADWNARLAPGAPFDPDFLWIHFDGPAVAPVLIAHHADRLWGFNADGKAIPGWDHSAGDTLVTGLGAGDPDGDGVPEVLTQSVHSPLTFW